jgi:hypothetical protein
MQNSTKSYYVATVWQPNYNRTDLQGESMTFIECHEQVKRTSIEKWGEALYEIIANEAISLQILTVFQNLNKLETCQTTFYAILNAYKSEIH